MRNDGKWEIALRTLRRPSVFLPVAFLLLVTGAATAGPLVGLMDPNEQNLPGRLRPPLAIGPTSSDIHWLGTDQLGRDVLSRVVLGARASAGVAVPAVSIAAVFGAACGLIAGYQRGLFEMAIMRVADIFLAFPFLLLALLLVAVLGPGIPTLVTAFVLADWPIFARTSRSESLKVRALPYVESARATGVPDLRILLRHILPNASTGLLVLFTLNIAKVMVAEASLSFLGLGVPPSMPSWGSVIADGRGYLATSWWISAFPGAILLIVVIAVNRLGDELLDALNPATTYQSRERFVGGA